ncbi:MAG: hypothetical protein ACHQ9S_24075 [Candidatus Binatia bacterium]
MTHAPKRATVLAPRWLKLVGGFVLLAAFITQYYLYDTWNSQLAELRAAFTDRAIVDKGVLLNQLMFFSLRDSALLPPSVAPEELRRQHIQEAARKGLLGLTLAMTAAGPLSDQDVARLRHLADELRGVRDYESFLSFVQLFNEANDAVDFSPKISALEARKRIARWIFLGLFAFGAALYYLGEFLSATGSHRG